MPKSKLFLFIAIALSLIIAGVGPAEAAAWQPANGNVQIPLWPGEAPGGHVTEGPETSGVDDGPLVAGKHWTWIQNVSVPTMTVFSPKSVNTGAAVVVFPGGGYDVLAIDLEGTEICDWFTSKGVTCVVLKYRVPHSGPQWNPVCKCQNFPKNPSALQDAQRAIGLLRSRAKEFKINPSKIGVTGFSAGGHLVAATSTTYDKRPNWPEAVVEPWLVSRGILPAASPIKTK